MDSGNSGSMQSSSGGDEEYDSSISPFLNPSTHFTSISNNNQQHQPSHPPPTFFDPSPHNLEPFSHPQSNSLYNLDFWPKTPRSEPNYTDLVNPSAQSSSSQSLLGSQGLSQGPLGSSSSRNTDQTNLVKNPKKRTRASRRAPTTVLTTDTTNFRQMVQEFTGIPAAPFSAATSPYSRRLDLYGAGSLGPLYPLRPSAQKAQPSLSSSFLNSSSIIDSLANNSSTDIASNSNDAITNIPNSQSMLNIQNPILTFQSLLQSHPTFGARSQENSRILSLDEMGMSNDHVNANLGGLPRNEHSGDGRWGGGDGEQHQEIFGSSIGKNVEAEKGMENINSRGEGTVKSWICPSD